MGKALKIVAILVVVLVLVVAGGAAAIVMLVDPNDYRDEIETAVRHRLAVVYLEVVRNTPLLIQIFFIYFVLGPVLGLDRFPAAVLALSLFEGAYASEIIRAGILAVPVGQSEAAASLGLNRYHNYRLIILPQALRRILPPLAGQFISLIKDSSLLGIIAIRELTKAAREVVSASLQPFEVYFLAAILYLVLTFTLSMAVQKLEKRMANQ